MLVERGDEVGGEQPLRLDQSLPGARPEVVEHAAHRGIHLVRSHDLGEEAGIARHFAEQLELKASHLTQNVDELSGGNQQKVVLGKWLATNPKVIILDEPTKGIDIGSKAAVHDFIGELAEEGLAVILISSELPEVMGLADRVLVMQEGRIVAEFARGGTGWSAERIVAAATGAPKTTACPARWIRPVAACSKNTCMRSWMG